MTTTENKACLETFLPLPWASSRAPIFCILFSSVAFWGLGITMDGHSPTIFSNVLNLRKLFCMEAAPPKTDCILGVNMEGYARLKGACTICIYWTLIIASCQHSCYFFFRDFP